MIARCGNSTRRSSIQRESSIPRWQCLIQESANQVPSWRPFPFCQEQLKVWTKVSCITSGWVRYQNQSMQDHSSRDNTITHLLGGRGTSVLQKRSKKRPQRNLLNDYTWGKALFSVTPNPAKAQSSTHRFCWRSVCHPHKPCAFTPPNTEQHHLAWQAGTGVGSGL